MLAMPGVVDAHVNVVGTVVEPSCSVAKS